MTTFFIDWPHAIYSLAALDYSKSLSDVSVAVICAAAVLLIGLTVAVRLNLARPHAKKPLFTLIAIVVCLPTALAGAAAVFMNIASPTGGPTRWAADFEIWACGNQIALRSPRGLLSDRIGTPKLFEQGDGRIHFEGTPTKLPDDATLGSFMAAIGGDISDRSLVVPLNDDNGFVGQPNAPEQIEPYLHSNRDGMYAAFIRSQNCGDIASEVQAFAYRYSPSSGAYYQTKLDHPADYTLANGPNVPPADCLIVEFAPPKTTTNHLCAAQAAAIKNSLPFRCQDKTTLPQVGLSAECARLREAY